MRSNPRHPPVGPLSTNLTTPLPTAILGTVSLIRSPPPFPPLRRTTMPSTVPGYEYDIFVSYSHDDNHAADERQPGWITQFCKDLEAYSKKVTGTNFVVWSDHRIDRSGPFDQQLNTYVDKSAVLLVINSPSYLNSVWCKHERIRYLKRAPTAAQDATHAPAFIVQLEHVEERFAGDQFPFGRPPEFSKLTPYEFHTRPDIDSAPMPFQRATNEYEKRLRQLVIKLAEKLQQMKELASAPAPSSPDGRTPAGEEDQVSAFIALTTDDLDDVREKVVTHLSQFGIRILPSSMRAMGSADEIESVIWSEMTRADIFVQLLSQTRGKPLSSLSETLPILQHRLARKAGLPIFQWRAEELRTCPEPAPTASPLVHVHHNLLNGPDVQCVVMPEFLASIRRQCDSIALSRIALAKPKADSICIAYSMAADTKIAAMISAHLTRLKIGWMVSTDDLTTPRTPKEIAESLSRDVLTLDGVILVYGSERAQAWVQQRLLLIHKERTALGKSDFPLAVIVGPPRKASLEEMTNESKWFNTVGAYVPKALLIDFQDGAESAADRLAEFIDLVLRS